MDVEAAQPRRIEDRLGQQQAIGRHDGVVRLEGGEFRLRFRRLQACRCADGKAALFGEELHRRLPERIAAPGGPRRLGIDGDDFMPASTKAFRATAAKSGVPMKISFDGVMLSRGNGLVALLRLQELAQDDVALQGGQVIDEQQRSSVDDPSRAGCRWRASRRPPSRESRFVVDVADLDRRGRVTSA